jgi:hypothetical protein
MKSIFSLLFLGAAVSAERQSAPVLQEDPIVASPYTAQLQYHLGVHYLGAVHVGDPRLNYYVELDLNVDKMILVDTTCKVKATGKECPSASKYNYKESKTEKLITKKKKYAYYKDYGFDLQGKEYDETVCMGKSATCAVGQRLLSVTTEHKEIDNMDGVMGMSPKDGTVFKNLVKAGYYKDIFAFHIGADKDQSHVTLGGMHDDYMANKTNIDYVHSDSSEWTSDVKGLMFNSTNVYSDKHKKAMFMLDSDKLVIPGDDFDRFRAQLYS